MNITQGIYRGIKLTISLMPETSGQIAITLEAKRKDFVDALKDGKIDERTIRKIFCLPNEDHDEFGTQKLSIHISDTPDEFGLVGFEWWFMFPCLKGRPTQYEYLHFLFNCIDELLRIINQWTNKVNEPQECPNPGAEGI